ncbi:MAG: hypothetical protein COX19_13625 [Desulfobacterales bacterium CG23_combo_of_CG06-09_8_20_14_all_51_8]|nr:MAG: hypothetical protein COX19_13625 [Desulfobacterales bacterium CG23_combo_of_CG06-09_8_20_14_all_51_8]
MDTQFVTDGQGNKTAVIVPFEEWERTEKAKEILEHVYLAGIIDERKNSKPAVALDDLLRQVIAIDKREDMEVYRLALKRIIAMDRA